MQYKKKEKKDKTEWDKQYLCVFSSSGIFWQSERGWKVFLTARWLYYDTRRSYFVPHVLCCVCMFVVFCFLCFLFCFCLFFPPLGPSKSSSEQNKTKTNEAVENSKGKTARVVFLLRGPAPNAVPVIRCQTSAVGFPIQFGDGGSQDPAQTAAIHLVAVKVSICRLLLFHFAKLISIYLKRVEDKHTVFEVHIKPGWQRVCRQGLSCEAVVSFLWLWWYVWFVRRPESVFSSLLFVAVGRHPCPELSTSLNLFCTPCSVFQIGGKEPGCHCATSEVLTSSEDVRTLPVRWSWVTHYWVLNVPPCEC